MNYKDFIHVIGVENNILEDISMFLVFCYKWNSNSQYLLKDKKMAFYNLQLEYALEGSSNFIAYKDRMEVVLEQNWLKEFIDQETPKPPTSDAQNLVG